MITGLGLQVLLDARERLSTPERWWQGGGRSRWTPNGVRMCLSAALYHEGSAMGLALGNEKLWQAVALVDEEIEALRGARVPMAHFNDAPETTHAEVMLVLSRAISRACEWLSSRPWFARDLEQSVIWQARVLEQQMKGQVAFR